MIHMRNLVFSLCSLVFVAMPSHAADRDRVMAFLQVTGFDVAIGSISQMAASAPELLGMPPNSFGADWTRLAGEVFDPDTLQAAALDMLEQTLSDDLLTHGAAFYASDFGQRLVEVENAAHLVDDDEKQQVGDRIIAELEATGDPRIGYYRRMQHAIDPDHTGLRAIQELQVRFLMAAAGAGVISLRVDEDGLRAMFAEQEDEMIAELERSGLQFSAFTYRDFTADEMRDYTEALEHPDMQQVYELLNAVHNALMISRFELLAWRMAELHPVQEL